MTSPVDRRKKNGKLLEGLRSLFGSPEKSDVEKVRAIGLDRLYWQVYAIIDARNAAEYEIAKAATPEDQYVEFYWLYLQELYFDSGALYALAGREGKLFRARVTVSADEVVEVGEFEQVTEIFAPVSNQRTVTRVFEQPDGVYRWLSVSATAYLNRVGEIDSRALFDSFVAHAAETGEYPYRTFMHKGEQLRTGQADYLARDGNVYITSGVYDMSSPLARIEIAALSNPEVARSWGESIGYQATAQPELETVADGVEVLVYKAGIHREISTCPEMLAAAWFTSPTITEVQRMEGTVRDSLALLMRDAGLEDAERDELLGAFEAAVDRTNERGSEAGVIARSVTTQPTPVERDTEEAAEAVEEVEEVVETTETEGEMVIDDSVLDALNERFGISTRLDELSEAVARLAEQVSGQVEVGRTGAASAADLARRVEQIEATLRTQQEVIEGAPEGTPQTLRVVYRPAGRENEVVNGNGVGNYADIAADTLSGIPRR